MAVGRPFFVDEWRPKVRDEEWQIEGIFFECFAKTDKVALSSNHDDYQWIDPYQYKKYELIPNIYTAFESYISWKD